MIIINYTSMITTPWCYYTTNNNFIMCIEWLLPSLPSLSPSSFPWLLLLFRCCFCCLGCGWKYNRGWQSLHSISSSLVIDVSSLVSSLNQSRFTKLWWRHLLLSSISSQGTCNEAKSNKKSRKTQNDRASAAFRQSYKQFSYS